jgi:hypothetical protein
MADKTSQIQLTKEVLAPQNPYNGLGVVIVSAMAMFMAVSSSALVVRARMARSCAMSDRAYQSELPAAVDWQGHAAAESCGVPEYQTNADGSVSVYFKVCAETDRRTAARSLGDLHLTSPVDGSDAADATRPIVVEVRPIR